MKKNCKNTVILDVIIVIGVATRLCYQRQNRNSYNDRVQRNQNQSAQRSNKGSKTTLQNQIQHEDGEIQENIHGSKVEIIAFYKR